MYEFKYCTNSIYENYWNYILGFWRKSISFSVQAYEQHTRACVYHAYFNNLWDYDERKQRIKNQQQQQQINKHTTQHKVAQTSSHTRALPPHLPPIKSILNCVNTWKNKTQLRLRWTRKRERERKNPKANKTDFSIEAYGSNINFYHRMKSRLFWIHWQIQTGLCVH